MNYTNVKICNQCNALYSPTWQEQESCTSCQPLTVDPAKLELIRGIAKKVWGGVRPNRIK